MRSTTRWLFTFAAIFSFLLSIMAATDRDPMATLFALQTVVIGALAIAHWSRK